MNIFYRHTKSIVLLLTLVNIALHVTSYYLGTQFQEVLITFFSSELILLLFYLVVTVYKWIQDYFKEIQEEQRHLFTQLAKSTSSNLERIEKLETAILDNFKITESNFIKLKEIIIRKIETSEESNAESKQLLIEHLEKFENDILRRLMLTEDTNTKYQEVMIDKIETSQKSNKESKQLLIERLEKFENDILGRLILTEEKDSKFKELLLDTINLSEEESFKIHEGNKEIIVEKINLLQTESLNYLKSAEKTRQSSNEKLYSNQQAIKQHINDSSSKNLNKLAHKFEKGIEKSKYEHDNLVEKIDLQYDKIDSLFSLYNYLEIKYPLPPMHKGRVSADLANFLIKKWSENPGNVIDIGSGVSTILLGYAMKKLNLPYKVYSFENHEYYFNETVNMVSKHGLEEYITIYLCPLIDCKINSQTFQWYDTSKISIPKGISILFVDGPPGILQKNSRYPAVPLLKQYFSENTIIILDDGKRIDEENIANLWANELKFNVIKHDSEKAFFELNNK